jgi:hypothetical protein
VKLHRSFYNMTGEHDPDEAQALLNDENLSNQEPKWGQQTLLGFPWGFPRILFWAAPGMFLGFD